MTNFDVVLAEAREWIGTSYRHQSSEKGLATDCLGLIRGVWRAVVGPEPKTAPPYTRDWAERHGSETLRDAFREYMIEIAVDDAIPGDVLLFRMREDAPAKHCGILSGGTAYDGTLIHAYAGVRRTIDGPMTFTKSPPVYAFRFPEASA